MIFTAVPVDVYYYDIVSSPLPAEVGTVMSINVPRELQTLSVSREFYNANNGEFPEIDATVLRHTIGDVASYPTRSDRDALLADGGLYSIASPVGVGEGTAYDFSRQGSASTIFLGASPAMRATLFDRPPVIDLALLSAIIHQNDPEENIALYAKVRRPLVPDGRFVIRDHVMSADRTRPPNGALFAVNMLVGTSGGSTYTFDEIREGLTAAGFERVRLLREDDDRMTGLLEGFVPSGG